MAGAQAGKTPRMRRHTGGVGGLQGAHTKVRIGLGRSKQGNTKGAQRVGSGRAGRVTRGTSGRTSAMRGNTSGS